MRFLYKQKEKSFTAYVRSCIFKSYALFNVNYVFFRNLKRYQICYILLYFPFFLTLNSSVKNVIPLKEKTKQMTSNRISQYSTFDQLHFFPVIRTRESNNTYVVVC